MSVSRLGLRGSKVACVLQSIGKHQARSIWGSSRHLPVWRRHGPFWEDLDHSWPWKMMDAHMRRMEKLMENTGFARPCFPWELSESPRTMAKDLEVNYTNEVFEVRLDVSSYNPEELNVKIVGDRLNVSAKHQERQDDHGWVKREFSRQLIIPKDVDPESLESLLTNEGHLVVRGKVKGAEDIKERTIDIQKEAGEAKDAGEQK